MEKIILSFETSCDETACALFSGRRGLLGERVYSQWRHHSAYGGVVPELAARDHLQRILPMADDLLHAHSPIRPTCLAYTAGPGLASSLLVAAAVARSLSFAWRIPANAVNHLEGHILSPLLSHPDFTFPYVALLISGGHTQLWLAKACGRYQLLGATLDDAAGEAFDKTSVLLGLGYPGGGAVEKLAAIGNAKRFSLPSPAQPDLNFSFSGLKTAVRRLAEKYPMAFADIAASFQIAVARGLAAQSKLALAKTGTSRLAVVGGVAQNNVVAEALSSLTKRLVRPLPKHCADNAAMIALAVSVKHIQARTDFAINPLWQPDDMPCGGNRRVRGGC